MTRSRSLNALTAISGLQDAPSLTSVVIPWSLVIAAASAEVIRLSKLLWLYNMLGSPKRGDKRTLVPILEYRVPVAI